MKKSVGKEIVFDGNDKITLRFSWDRYKKQHSLGLLSGLIDKAQSSIDCDASAFLVKETDGKKEVSCIGYEKLTSDDGGVVHGGDNSKIAALGNNETIAVDFSKLSADLRAIVFTLDMLKEEKQQLMLGKLEHVNVSISDQATGDILGDFNIIGMGDKAILAGALVRSSGKWVFKPEVAELKDVTDRNELIRCIDDDIMEVG